MKKIIKHSIKKIPGVSSVAHTLFRTSRKIDLIQEQLDTLEDKLSVHDSRVDQLRILLNQVEHYQPAYHIAGVIESPMRNSLDRCRAIESYIGNIPGLRLLDIGASLGYVCFYFADRGALAEGWEYNPKNAEAARLIGQINGIEACIRTKPLDMETVRALDIGKYDVVTILSVLHHTIHYNGLEYTQKLMEELLKRVPLVIVELAKKGEDPKLFWDNSQPEDPLSIFALVKDKIRIDKIGEFTNHLSSNTRPLYAISLKDKVVRVNNRRFIYEHATHEAYPQSPVAYSGLVRKYYFTPNHIIKEYEYEGIEGSNPNISQIVNELNSLLSLDAIHNMPKLEDFELSNSKTSIVLERIEGDLLVSHLGEPGIDPLMVAKDVIKSLLDLQAHNLHHNDVRSWNIIFKNERFHLIDYGLVSPKDIDNDLVSLLWLLHAVLTGSREDTRVSKKELPPRASFNKQPQLLKLYKKISSGRCTLEEAERIISNKK